jgi:ubiquinone/menaquinone biosynthesis C-methylase UbiE
LLSITALLSSVLLSITVLLLIIFVWKAKQRGKKHKQHPVQVGEFYDRHFDDFLKVYGDVIQAFRTTDYSKLLNYEAAAMGLKEGMLVLDAGCGICGPAIYFAKEVGVRIDAVTISAKQVSISEEKIRNAHLTGDIKVYHGDYHHFPDVLSRGVYDVVYFLESFGHSHDKANAIASAWDMLKPGGVLYIKDLFVKEMIIPKLKKTIEENVRRINEAYRYHISSLYDVLSTLRKKGFILSFIKTIDIPLEEFENLTISNEFQELTGINKIQDLDTYVFPVDFFELACIKPWYDPLKGSNRYFLQNLYYLQILNRPENEL